MFFYIEFIISCGFLLVYIENISSFYLNDVYSLAFPTSIGLFILSILHLFMLKFQIWPLNIVDQNSIQSKLVRSFLPIILFFIIIGNAIESHLIAENSENFTNSLLLFILIVLIVVSYQIISKNLEKELNEAFLCVYVILFLHCKCFVC